VGKGIALELLLTGRPIPADEAYRIGLVNRVVPPERLLEEARALASELAAKPPIAARFIIDAVNRGSDGSFEQGTFLEATLFGLAFATSDMREGTRAFLEKRKPVFTGE
jgi:enoyl-CoA hydratase